MKKIYILHGWAYSTERWKPLIDELKSGGLNIEMLKIPGLTAPLNEVWNINNYIEWLNNILKNDHSAGSGQEKIILIGHSNGGLISIGYALQYPEKVAKLILIDTTAIYHKELIIRTKRLVFLLLAKVGKKLTKSDSMRKILYKLARNHDYEQANPISQKTMVNLLKVDYSQRLKNIKIPTTIIWGENDFVTPKKDGEIIKREISDSKLYIIKDARHSPQFTHHKEVAEIIKKAYEYI